MAEAIHTVAEAELRTTAKAPLTAYQAALRARMITAACTLAHHRALRPPRFALTSSGAKVVNFSHRELSLLAIEYAKRNGEGLLNDAPRRSSTGGSRASSASGRRLWGMFPCSPRPRAECSHLNTPRERSPRTRGNSTMSEAAPITANRTLRRLPNAAYRVREYLTGGPRLSG